MGSLEKLLGTDTMEVPIDHSQTEKSPSIQQSNDFETCRSQMGKKHLHVQALKTSFRVLRQAFDTEPYISVAANMEDTT